MFSVSVVWTFTFQESERAVSKEEGMALAKEHRCLFLECSAKTRENVQQCFEDLTLKVSWFLYISVGLDGYLVPLLGHVSVCQHASYF
jgi:hypothetical protein